MSTTYYPAKHQHSNKGCLGWFVVIIIIVLVVFSSCASTRKYGCPSEDQRVLDKAARQPFKA